jgi:hypothetical protein
MRAFAKASATSATAAETNDIAIAVDRSQTRYGHNGTSAARP